MVIQSLQDPLPSQPARQGPESAGPFVATLVRSIFAQPDREAVWAQFRRVVKQLSERFPAAAEMLEDAGADILAFTAFPFAHWKHACLMRPPSLPQGEDARAAGGTPLAAAFGA